MMCSVHLRMLAADEHLMSGDCCDNASARTVDFCKASQALADIAELLQCERFSYVKLLARHEGRAALQNTMQWCCRMLLLLGQGASGSVHQWSRVEGWRRAETAVHTSKKQSA